MLDIQAFYYHKTHKNNSNHVAVLECTCCVPPILLRLVDSLRHTHAFSRVTLREFLGKWAIMAAPMISENVRFKIYFILLFLLQAFIKRHISGTSPFIGAYTHYNKMYNFMMYDILTKLNKTTYVTIIYLEWYVGIGGIVTHF